MGESALKSHQNSEKHKRNSEPTNSLMLETFGIRKIINDPADPGVAVQPSSPQAQTGYTPTADENNNKTIPTPPPTQQQASPSSSQNMNRYVTKNQVLKAEILWTLKTVTSHCSYKSNENVNDVFRSMFPDSEIAQRFSCGERKTSYMCVFGLAKYFKKQTLAEVKGHFVLLFDESLNKKMQKKQMDIHVRYWESNQEAVVTRYLGSQFMGHAKAEDLVQAIKAEVTDHLNVRDMLQISMDGPSVNIKLLKIFKEEVESDFGHLLVDIGSCGLHTMHNAFKFGESNTEWEVCETLCALYNLFKDCPARREDYLSCCAVSSRMLPLKYVSHRWLENVPVCKCAMNIWSSIVRYVEKVNAKEFPKPTCKSYETVKSAVGDKLFLAKLEFFCSVASVVQPFLEHFQSDKPLVPFLAKELADILRSLLRRVMKKDMVDAAHTFDKIARFNLEEGHLVYSRVNIGMATEERLKCVQGSEKQLMEFRMECKKFILGVLKKLLDKSPLNYSLVRQFSCLDPREMVKDKTGCYSHLKKLLKLLISFKRIDPDKAEIVLCQYERYLDNIAVIGSQRFTGFVPFGETNDRVDTFLISTMDDSYNALKEILRLLLLLSHGQATVERGFSINKEIEVENMQQQTLVAHRLICDYVNRVGGVMKVPITDELLVSAASARQKYEQALENKRQQKAITEQMLKRRAVLEEVETFKKQKKQVEIDVEHLEMTADKLFEKAETTGKMQFVAEANALRRAAKEKKETLTKFAKKIDETELKLKAV